MERYEYGNPDSANVLVQMIGEHEVSGMEKEIAHIRESAGEDFFLLAFKVDDWNMELSPWRAPAVFGNEGFGGGADDTLKKLLAELKGGKALHETSGDEALAELKGGKVLHETSGDEALAELKGGKALHESSGDEALAEQVKEAKVPLHKVKKYFIGGYSLAGLFALWAAYRTDFFEGVAAASPSIWFPGFVDYMKAGTINADKVYLSLGKREAKTRNPVMATVADCIERSFDLLRQQGVTSTLEWNEGNHFNDADVRTAKAFSWVLSESVERVLSR